MSYRGEAAKENPVEKIDRTPPTMGATIRYVLREGRHAGETRAAVVTQAFADTPARLCNGTVHIDMANDMGAEPSELFFASAHYDDSEAPGRGTWHWPPLEGIAVTELRQTEGVSLDLHLHGASEAADELEAIIRQLREAARLSDAAGVSGDAVTARVLEELAPLVDHHLGEQLRQRAARLRDDVAA